MWSTINDNDRILGQSVNCQVWLGEWLQSLLATDKRDSGSILALSAKSWLHRTRFDPGNRVQSATQPHLSTAETSIYGQKVDGQWTHPSWARPQEDVYISIETHKCSLLISKRITIFFHPNEAKVMLSVVIKCSMWYIYIYTYVYIYIYPYVYIYISICIYNVHIYIYSNYITSLACATYVLQEQLSNSELFIFCIAHWCFFTKGLLIATSQCVLDEWVTTAFMRKAAKASALASFLYIGTLLHADPAASLSTQKHHEPPDSLTWRSWQILVDPIFAPHERHEVQGSGQSVLRSIVTPESLSLENVATMAPMITSFQLLCYVYIYICIYTYQLSFDVP